MENKNLSVIKACIYADADKHYVPVAFMAEQRSVGLWDVDNQERVSFSNGKANLHPQSCGVRIVPMGKYTPINGTIERMTLTDFENTMEMLGFHFLATIPCDGMKESWAVYRAFKLMLKGSEVLSKTETDYSFAQYHPTSMQAIIPHIIDMCHNGKRVAAVVLYRELYKVSLHDAYEAIKELEK